MTKRKEMEQCESPHEAEAEEQKECQSAPQSNRIVYKMRVVDGCTVVIKTKTRANISISEPNGDIDIGESDEVDEQVQVSPEHTFTSQTSDNSNNNNSNNTYFDDDYAYDDMKMEMVTDVEVEDEDDWFMHDYHVRLVDGEIELERIIKDDEEINQLKPNANKENKLQPFWLMPSSHKPKVLPQPKYRDLINWLSQQCPPDVVRYIHEFLDFPTVIHELENENPEMKEFMLLSLNDNWWIRFMNRCWYGYFSKELLEFIYKTAEIPKLWGILCSGFELNTNCIIYTILRTLYIDLNEYSKTSLNQHLKKENENLLEHPLYMLPAKHVRKHKIPSFIIKCLVLQRWTWDALTKIPWSFAPSPYRRVTKVCLKPAEDIYGAPRHPFVTWLFYEDAGTESHFTGFYTGPVYAYEEEWNKDLGILVEDTDGNNADLAKEKRSKASEFGGSARIRKYYLPDSGLLPIVLFAPHDGNFRMICCTIMKCAEEILACLRTRNWKLNNYSYRDLVFPSSKDDDPIFFPWHLLGDMYGDSFALNPCKNIYQYLSKYSVYWMTKVREALESALQSASQRVSIIDY